MACSMSLLDSRGRCERARARGAGDSLGLEERARLGERLAQAGRRPGRFDERERLRDTDSRPQRSPSLIITEAKT